MSQSLDDVRSHLTSALGGDGPSDARGASALRLRVRLQPAGGSGGKVMPPTYSGDRGPVYVTEERRMEGATHRCVLLDSVASQANRLEDALAAAYASGDVRLPIIEVDQGEFGRLSGLHFSHRLFDAWVEDAHLDGRRFGETEIYKRLAGSNRHDVKALMETFPVGILLGCWASREKNPQGTTRLPRIVASEIIAVDAVDGVRPESRIDRHHVSAAIPIYEPNGDGRFTLDPGDAKSEKGKPVPFRGKGKPSEAGYGNVTPSLADHGGITMDHALQIATVSLPGLRECSFPTQDGTRDRARDVSGRLMLAALAMHMLALQLERGYDLRSGCLLVPEQEPTLELVGRLGATVATWPLMELDTGELLDIAQRAGGEHDLRWDREPLALTASAQQLELLKRSLEVAEPEAVA